MKINYYYSKKKKLLTFYFNHILEKIQFENSYRGLLLWILTPKTVRVFGYWKQGCIGSRKFYQSCTNNHCTCD